MVDRYCITALDFSPRALARYRMLYDNRAEVLNGDLFHLPVADDTFDGIYNMGVMEHFVGDEIERRVAEFRRLVKPGGHLVLFWPPEFGLSVIVLKSVHFVLNHVLRRNVHLHPAEPSRLLSRRAVAALLARQGFKLSDFHFTPADFSLMPS